MLLGKMYQMNSQGEKNATKNYNFDRLCSCIGQ